MDAPIDDMLTNENEGLRERVFDLEKKVQEQTDEIVCLRSSLADILRRLNVLETIRVPVTPNNIAVNHTKGSYYSVPASPNNPSTPLSSRRTSSAGYGGHNSPVQNNQRPRSTIYQQQQPPHYEGSMTNGSSPSPSQSSSMRGSPSPNRLNGHHPLLAVGSNSLSKKWSSNQDVHSAVNNSLLQRQLSSNSLLNMHGRSSSSLNLAQSPITQSKHGTKEATYNLNEGHIKMFLRGRPILLHAPSTQAADYSLIKVNGLPQQKLRLDWVYGYRGRDCRSNLHYLPTGEMIYFVAAVVVLYNVQDQMQRHYLGHTDDVKCMTVHPNKLIIATGQVAGIDKRDGRPHIRVWDSVSLNTLHVIGVGDFERAVSCISFSKLDGGILLCGIDEATDHNMFLWDWQKGERGHKIMETKCSMETVLSLEFHPIDRYTIITCGRSHISFWCMDGMTLVKKLGIFENRDKPKFILCLAYSETGDLLSGDSNGSILIWARGSNKVLLSINGAHEGGVFSICSLKDGNFLSGGGKDRKLREWDGKYRKTGRHIELPDYVGPVRTIAQGRGNVILVGTTRNCILQGSVEIGFLLVVQGHTDELWGLAIHPLQNQFVSCGFDKMVHLWDTMSHSVVWSKDIGECARCVNFSPDGNVLVVATTTGKWLVMDSETREVFSMHSDGNEAISVVKFSPDGKFLTLCSHDNYTYVYAVSEEYRRYTRIARCVGHSSFITHLDWSSDSTVFRTNSGDYELLYWNASTCRQITSPSQMKDIEWQTHTCTISFNSVGIWPDGADGTDVNTCAKSNNSTLIATGDDWGKIKLYTYPACQPKALCHIYGGHSSHVTNVDFLMDDTRLITIGGKDTAILQWSVL